MNYPIRLILGALILWIGFGAITPSWAAPYSFSVDGAEVTDQATGLIWRRCPEGMSWQGETCTGWPTYMMWYESLQYTRNVARATGVVWRVPNIKELASLLDRGQGELAIDVQAFPGTVNDQYWSSTYYAADSFFGWVVHFYFGSVYYTYLEDMGALRLVRDPGPENNPVQN